MNITGCTIEKLEDPTGILIGDRYEFIINIEVPDDDELFSANGLYVKIIFAIDDHGARIAQYQLFESNTNNYLDFELEDDEQELLLAYCKEQMESI